MTFIGKTTNDLISIVRAGGGIRLDQLNRSMDDLMQIAAATKSGGGQLILMGMSIYNTGELIHIARAGSGHVVFED